MAVGSRQDQEAVSVIVKFNGVTYGPVLFQTFQGGAVAATSVKNRQGGMGNEESLGGPKSREAITVSKIFDLEKDLPNFKFLDNACGAGQVSIGRQKLTPNKIAYGNPINYTGTLMKVMAPDSDSNANEKAEFSLEIDADEEIN